MQNSWKTIVHASRNPIAGKPTSLNPITVKTLSHRTLKMDNMIKKINASPRYNLENAMVALSAAFEKKRIQTKK